MSLAIDGLSGTDARDSHCETGRAPFFRDDAVTLWHGDCREVLAELPDGSVNCIVTSPPYLGLRDYSSDEQVGQEATVQEFTGALVDVFARARRVLADDGTLWLNLGDSYVHSRHSGRQGASGVRATRQFTAAGAGGARGNLPDKNLMGVPWRVALALQDDGWLLRNAIAWVKTNAQPSSARDRLTNRYEQVFLFSKGPSYWFDLDAIRMPNRRALRPGERSGSPLGVNPGDVWEIATQPSRVEHFAVMPVELARRCVAAGCPPGGVVLDPFSGSGTTGLAAEGLGRRYVGVDANGDYLSESLRSRLVQPLLDMDSARG